MNAFSVLVILGFLSPSAVGVSKLSAPNLRQAVNKRWNSPVYRVPVAQKAVALTFDDGPSPQFTPQILQILNAYGVKATFFVVGSQARLYPSLVREIAGRGHVIGNHTFTHPSDIRELSEAQLLAELFLTSRAVEQAAGIRPRLFRPPKGKISSRELWLVESHGYQVVLWSVSADHREAKTPQQMAARVIRLVRPGAIILMHDGPLPIRWRDAAALPLIIEELRSLGYCFVTVPELLQEKPLEFRSGQTANSTDRSQEETGKNVEDDRTAVSRSGLLKAARRGSEIR
ncbi:MAG: polysaccharide deacetylase family protein, partial [Armatimonadota bacterium]